MLKVKSVRTIGIVGDSTQLERELIYPIYRHEGDKCFYYKSALYRLENVDDAAVRVVVFSACDLFCDIEQLLMQCDSPKTVVYLTNCRRARRMGLKIDKKRLSYMLECPVVYENRFFANSLNKLLSTIHIVSDTPSYYTALDNPCIARKTVVGLRGSFYSFVKSIVHKFVKI